MKTKTPTRLHVFIGRQVPTLIVLCLCVIGLILLPFQIPVSKAAQASALGPRFFPTVMLCAAAVCCIISILSESYCFFARGENLKSFPLAPVKQYGKVLCLVAALLVWYVLLHPIGFVIMTVCLMIISMLLLGNRHVWQVIAIPCLTSVLIYLVFANFLNVPLPAGILPL